MSRRPISSHPNPALRGLHLPAGTPSATPFYWFCRGMLQVLLPFGWKIRVFNRRYEPTAGGVVYMCNHQSFLDPMLLGFGLRRPLNYMARESLFHNPVFGRIISAVGAFPVRRGKADTAALKEALRRVKRGEQMGIFPEGTRTRDGRIGPFLPGVAFLAQRTGAVTVPVVIDGAYECWPRTQAAPSLGSIVVRFGRPYSPQRARAMKPQAFVDAVRRDMIAMQTDMRRRLGRPALNYDKE